MLAQQSKRFAVYSLLLTLLFAGAAAEADERLVIAHRGASGQRPEHTEGSYDLAIEQGADYIECDLVMTKDGVPIIRHENEISGTTDVAEKFPKLKTTKIVDGDSITGWFAEDLTLKEIKTLRAKERVASRNHEFDGRWPVLTFDEFLALAAKKAKEKQRVIGVYVETKHPTYFKRLNLPLEEKVAASIKRADLNRADAAIFLQSFELSSLQKLKALTQAKLIFLLDESKKHPADFLASGDPRTYGDLLKPIGLSQIKKTADGIGPWKNLLLETPDVVKNAHSVGLKVHPYTFRSDKEFLSAEYKGDPGAEYARFFALGVDGVFSDFPADAIRARSDFKKVKK